MVEKALPVQPFASTHAIVKIITDQYAKIEQISEINKDDYPNSAVLDSTYFAKTGFSVNSIIENTYVYYPERIKQLNSWNKKYLDSIKEWNPINGLWEENHPEAMEEYKKILEVDR